MNQENSTNRLGRTPVQVVTSSRKKIWNPFASQNLNPKNKKIKINSRNKNSANFAKLHKSLKLS